MPVTVKKFIPAIAWFVFITILFLLPGSDFPDEDWFHRVYLDKWVHTGFFFVLVWLFIWPLVLSPTGGDAMKWMFRISVLTIAYGICIEYIQKAWIPGRSFDVVDMIFDSLGVIAAYFAGMRKRMTQLKK